MPISFAENAPSFNASNSLRFDGSTAYLAKRNLYEGNTQIFTQSVWVKRTLGRAQWIGPTTFTTQFKAGLYFDSNDKLTIWIHYNFRTARWEGALTTQQVFRDSNAWYHIVFNVDTTQVVASERIKLYVNGIRINTFEASANSPTYPSQNQQTVFNTINSLAVSAINNVQISPDYTYIGYDPTDSFGGYLSQMYWVDGLALTPTSFGRYDQNGTWIPRAYSGSYGPNGFYLPFNNTSTRSYLGLNMGDPAGADPYRSFTTFHLQTRTDATTTNNNTFIDSSPTNATITRTGNVIQGTFNPFGNIYPPLCSCSAYFNGNAELNAGNNANFSFGTGAYTVEFWVYSTTESYTAGTGPFFVCNDASGGWAIWNPIGGAAQGLKVQTRTTGITILDTATLLPINRWNHIAVCREGTTIALWLNGRRIGLGGDTTNWTIDGPLKLGGISTANYYLRGWMSDINIQKGICKYSTSSTTISIPTQPITSTGSTVLLCNFRNAAIYDSTNFNNIDTQGTARVSTVSPKYGTSSLLLDTSSSALSTTLVNSSPNFSFATEDFTIESWINIQEVPPSSWSYIAAVHDAVSVNTWILGIDDSFRVILYGANSQTFTSSNSITRYNWTHVAATRSGDFVTLYINGESGGTFRVAGLSYSTNNAAFHIGRRDPLGGPTINQFFGYISDLRITRAARYLQNFTPPQAALPNTGRKNNWWPINFTVNNSREDDSLIDSPTNINTNNTINATLTSNINGNYCMLSPIAKSANATLSNGNLDLSTPQGTTNWRTATSTIFLSSGKWYWEVECTAGSPTQTMFGIARSDWANTTVENTYPGVNGETWAYYGFTANSIYRNGAAITPAYTAATISVGDVVGCALDLDNGNFFVSKNGVWQGAIPANPSIGRSPANNVRLAPGAWGPSIGVYNQNASNIGAVACNFGQRPFLYADSPVLSAGFRPINTAFLQTPTIRKPSSFFNAISYTGGTNTFNLDNNAGNLVLALPLDSYNTYFDVCAQVSNSTVQPKALYTTNGVTYTALSGALFNGTSSYIELSSHPDFEFGTNNWTVEWYMNWTDPANPSNQTIFNNNATTTPNFMIQTTSSSTVGRLGVYAGDGPGATILEPFTGLLPPVANTWIHYAVVRNGSNFYIFRDGVITAFRENHTPAFGGAGSPTFRPTIGRPPDSGVSFVNGRIKDFRIYKGIAKYTSNFNPLTATTAIVATTGTGFDKSFNLGFQPDLVWVKARNIGRTSHILVDSTRGNTSMLSANSTNVNSIDTNSVTINTNGFSVGGSSGGRTPNIYLNTAGATYTAYGWKRNLIAGFDIVNFNKLNATNETFNHRLGRIPEMIIVKGISAATNWNVYHSASVNTNPASVVTTLNTQAASAIDITMWNNTSPTASQFSLGTVWPAGNYVAYLFAEIPGFSRFGGYRGTGSADGQFVWTGFKPKFVMTKRIDTTGDWLIWDSSRGPINPISPHFTVNSAFQDNSIISPTYSGNLDFVSTGFKMRLASDPNSIGGNFIYAAFAEEPFGRTPSQIPAK